MERQKLSIEQFNEIKEGLNMLRNEGTSRINHNERHDIIFYEYLPLLHKLLSYDLSDIPFESWKDIELFTMNGDPIDFSNTRANIDFNYLKLKQKAIFKGCNVKNLEKRTDFINDDIYDYDVVESNPELFLSNKFSSELRDKIYNDIVTIEFLSTLTSEQIDELKTRKMITKLNYKSKEFSVVKFLGFDKTLELYKYSINDYNEVSNVINNYALDYEKKLNMKDTFHVLEIHKIKEACYELLRESILEDEFTPVHIESFTQEFINNNKDIFIEHTSLPDPVKKRWYNKELTYNDIVNNLDTFIDLPIDKFIEECNALDFIKELGPRNFQLALKNHRDVMEYLMDYKEFSKFLNYYDKNVEFDMAFSNAVKYYYINNYLNYLRGSINSDKNIKLPHWISSMNFKVKDKIRSAKELESLTDKTIVLDEGQSLVFSHFGIENIKKFQNEINFYNKNEVEDEIILLNLVGMYLKNRVALNYPNVISYDEFTDLFAKTLDRMRYIGCFEYFVRDYEFIEGEFREKYPFLFISEDAPGRLRTLFYEGAITAEELRLNKEYIPYLLDKNLENVIKGNYRSILGNFVKLYSRKCGNEELLKLLSKYGKLCEDLTKTDFYSESTKEQLENQFRENVYKSILSNKSLNYKYLIDLKEDEEISKFISSYPSIFIEYDSIPIDDEKEKKDFYERFYKRDIKFSDIFKHPKLIEYLKDKDLRHIFKEKETYGDYSNKLLRFFDLLDNEKALIVFSKYGDYLNQAYKYIDFSEYPYSYITPSDYIFDKLCKEIENVISTNCLLGNMKYNIDDAPDFLKNRYPQIFLDEDAPADLKKYFYGNVDDGTRFDFYLLKQHPEWLPYLKDKWAHVPILRNFPNKNTVKNYFQIFGQETALKLGIQKTTSVMEMIGYNQVELMKDWYDKTGQKFIPDFVVMQNFPIEESDKFFTSAQKWSSLMKIERYSDEYETRDALLKLAYSFGVFDNDQLGFKKLKEILVGIPKTIQIGGDYIVSCIDSYINNPKLLLSSEKEEYMKIIDTLEEEGYQFVSSKNIFEQIYKKNSDGSYTLIMNQQNYPKSSELIRELLENFSNLIHILDPEKAHQLFSGFEFKYDKEFRDFLLSNLDEILESSDYGRFLPNIQKQFKEIKAFNSNRTLTLDLAISFVQNNKYTNIEVGNEGVAEISSIAGYSQSDFDTLQEIYNYGKQRTFSSIPRIENKEGIYTYEMLRLDDPLAMAIGTLTDCCQELGNVAEVCMEHSMVDKNGRIFVIRDEDGNIVSQSWVWRNKDVLCFDNIEIPDKAFNRAKKSFGLSSRRDFTDEVYNIYKKAAHELIEEDEKVYKKLLDEGKITSEQYEGLKLGKITVGLGYNDIAESLKVNSKMDREEITRPLYFKEPVKLDRNLYTNDSSTQYVLEQRDDRIEYDGDTLAIHPDTYEEYTDKNFTINKLFALQKLEMATKDDPYYLETQISEDEDPTNLVSSLATNYGLNPEATKIIMHPNFAIIYEANENNVKIAELLYNPIITNETEEEKTKIILIQIKLALEQISKDKKFDIDYLSDNAKKVINEALNINEEIDIERGIRHAK